MLTNKAPWVILLVLWMIGSTWWHVCKIKQFCIDSGQRGAATGETELYTTPPGADGFAISDAGRFNLELPHTFSFAKSDANANINALGGSIAPLIGYLKANPTRRLDIIGYYAPGETNTTPLPNLGMARAEGVKQYLMQQGVPVAALTTHGEERILPFTTNGDSLKGGLTFAFDAAELVATMTAPKPKKSEPKAVEPLPAEVSSPASSPGLLTLTEPVTENELANAQKFTSVSKPMDLYFQLGEASYIKTSETKKFFEEAIKVLMADKGKKLRLTGYTDNSGPDNVNKQLSLDRANDVKMRLRKIGIPLNQIVVRAKGEAEPKADNSTLSGRKANRRVTVVVN